MSSRRGVLAAGLAISMLPLTLLLLGGVLASTSACPSRTGAEQVPTDGAVAALDAEQLRVAQEIVAAVREFPATSSRPRAAVIALATARQESGLRNLTYGDRDSLGVFQQRPSQGWGSAADVLDVAHATTSFLERLVLISDWESLPLTVAASAVQRPAVANEGLYAQWELLATDLVDVLWRGSTSVPAEACGPGPLDTYGVVTYPVPVALAGSDRHNWGGRGPRWSNWHTGTDFSVPCGTAVLAATSGTVEIETGPDWYGDQLVKVVTQPGEVSTWYAHMRRVSVSAGTSVVAGQQIGEVGRRGNTTGCHLHFEVHLQNGDIYGPDNTDPSAWLAEHVGIPLPVTATPGTARARIATLNVLGASHTATGGNSANHTDGRTRMQWAVDALLEHQVDIVGMQEFEPVQETAFEARTGSGWGHYPHSGGNAGSANVVAWRADRWSLLAADRLAVPYFGGHKVGVPYVLLQNSSNQMVWVISVHNPADTRGPAQKWRDQAVGAELELMDRLSADGTPVVLVGDMNEREAFFCAATASGTNHAAGAPGSGMPCTPPGSLEIDWIVGTAAVGFAHYTSTREPPLEKATDHPLVYADATFALVGG